MVFTVYNVHVLYTCIWCTYDVVGIDNINTRNAFKYGYTAPPQNYYKFKCSRQSDVRILGYPSIQLFAWPELAKHEWSGDQYSSTIFLNLKNFAQNIRNFYFLNVFSSVTIYQHLGRLTNNNITSI